MKSEIHEICGDYALDIDNIAGGKITIYINHAFAVKEKGKIRNEIR